MTYSPIPAGTQNWDVPVNAAFTSQDASITGNTASIAALDGRLTTAEANINTLKATAGAISLPVQAQSFPPETMQAATTMGAGNVIMTRVDLPKDATITNLIIAFVTAGSGLTAGQNFAGLYDSTGTRIGITADQSVAWTTAGAQTMALTAPVFCPAGAYYVAAMANGTTRPGLGRAASINNFDNVLSYGLPIAQYRWAFGGVGLTALPASVVMSTRATLNIAFWAAVS